MPKDKQDKAEKKIVLPVKKGRGASKVEMGKVSGKQKEIENWSSWRVFGFEFILFSVSLVLGILTGFRLEVILEARHISLPPVSIWYFLSYFLLATFAILALIYILKFQKRKKSFLRGLFILAVGFGNVFFFSLWWGDIVAVILTTFLIIMLVKKPSLLLHNLVIVCATAGIGAGLGLRLQPEVVVLLLLIFSVYDFVAVYKTKHMVKMAKEMLRSGAILGLIIPQKISDFQAHLKRVKPGGRFLILGGGDVVFPLLLAISVLPRGIIDAIVVAAFSLAGLLLGFLIFASQKTRQPMPALPPIALFSVIGYLITILLW